MNIALWNANRGFRPNLNGTCSNWRELSWNAAPSIRRQLLSLIDSGLTDMRALYRLIGFIVLCGIVFALGYFQVGARCH